MLQSIGSLLHYSVRKNGIEEEVEASRVIEFFHEDLKRRFGPKVSRRAQAKSLKNRVLTVAVLNSVLANEIKLHEPEFIEDINIKFKKTLVERLRFLL